MPGMNGKGPLGNGPRSGRQHGVCKQTGIAKPYGQPKDATTDATQVQGQGLGHGRCSAGLGRRRGGGNGQGNGGKRGQ